nr:MAG TPA: hypothetical protein [Caudoviricetes sp.]
MRVPSERCCIPYTKQRRVSNYKPNKKIET